MAHATSCSAALRVLTKLLAKVAIQCDGGVTNVEQVASVSRLTPDEVACHVHDLVRLQRSAYAVEAELIGDDRIPPLTETAEELLSSGLTWHVLRMDGEIVAALALIEEDGLIDIDRLMVSPQRHRHGLAKTLIGSLPAGPAVVSTGRDNTPARRLYEALGFTHAEDQEVIPGLWVSSYRRRSSGLAPTH